MAVQVVYYRLWAGPSENLPLEDFDNVPHDRLADRLEEHGRQWVEQEYGSLEVWLEVRAKEDWDRYMMRKARIAGTPGFVPTRSASTPRKDKPPRTEESCLASMKSDARPMLLQLITDSRSIQIRRGGGIYVSRTKEVEPLSEAVSAPTYFFHSTSGMEDAELVRAHMQRKHSGDYVPESRILGTKQWGRFNLRIRFGAASLEDLAQAERVDALDQLEKSGNSKLRSQAERGLLLERMALGIHDEPAKQDYEGLAEGQFLLLRELASTHPESTLKATLASKLNQSESKVEKAMKVLREWDRPGPLAISGQDGYAAMPEGVKLVERLTGRQR